MAFFFNLFHLWVIGIFARFYLQVVNKINVEIDCFPAEVMNLPLHAGRVADDTKQREVRSDVEGMELQSTFQGVLMSDPEKCSPSPNTSQEDSRVSQSGKVSDAVQPR